MDTTEISNGKQMSVLSTADCDQSPFNLLQQRQVAFSLKINLKCIRVRLGDIFFYSAPENICVPKIQALIVLIEMQYNKFALKLCEMLQNFHCQSNKPVAQKKTNIFLIADHFPRLVSIYF